MNPEDEQDKTQNEQEQQSLGDQGVTKKIAKKGLQTLRGFGVAGEAAGETAAGAGIAGTTEAAAATTAGVEGATATTAAGAATTGGASTSTAALAGGSTLGWAIGATLITVFILTIVIVIIGGGGVPINAGTDVPPVNSCTDAGGTCKTSCDSTDTESATVCDGTANKCCVAKSTIPKCETNPTDCLKDDFNITVRGDTNQEKLNDIYSLLSEVSASSKYKNLLKSSGPTIIELKNDSKDYCHGWVHGYVDKPTLMELWNFDAAHCTKTRRRDHITHESGHVIANGHGRLWQLFYSNAYYPEDRKCYYYYGNEYPWFIKTYQAQYTGGGGGGWSESFAESIALYVHPIDELSRYPTQCPTGHAWIGKNVFGDYVFN